MVPVRLLPSLGLVTFNFGYGLCSLNSVIMFQAGEKTGDRVWRMPLFKHYTKHVTECPLADLVNTSFGNAGRKGGACCAAAFLRVSSMANPDTYCRSSFSPLHVGSFLKLLLVFPMFH